MLNIIISILMLSPSNIERSLGLLENPSGVGVHPGYEFTYIYPENYYLLSFGKTGLGIKYHNDSIYIITGSTILSYKDRISFGVGFNGETENYLIGLTLRPLYGFSIGVCGFLKSFSDINTHIGISFQPPNTDRVTITGRYDLSILPSLIGKKQFAEIYSEPIDGIGLRFGYNFADEEFFGGFTLSLGYLRGRHTITYHENKLYSYNTTLQASVIPFPSFIKRYKKWIVVEISGDYPEAPTRKFFRKGRCFLDLLTLLNEIKEAKYIKRVLFIFRGNSLGGAQAEEIHTLIKQINEEKSTYAYTESPGLKNLYMAGACDTVVLPPSGNVNLPGIAVIKSYMKELLEKLGIDVEVARIGKYKSAVEPFISDTMSTADRKQINAYIKSIVDVMAKGIAKDRNIPFEKFSSLVDTVGYFTAREAVKYHLADTLLYLDDLKNWLNIKDNAKPLHGKEVPRALVLGFKPSIAVIVAEGSITNGKSSEPILPLPLIGGKTLGSETFVSTIKKVMENPSIKGAVIRVNSPGGDALASDIIWNAIKKLAKKKPVVISMGDVAASGGYYISAGGEKIFADRTTLTGSIGIFGGKFVMEKLYKKIGINHQSVKWGKHADAFSDYRTFDREERKRLERIIRSGYEMFVDRVSQGRGIEKDSVDVLGRGRIWSGMDGKKIGLVDKNGGLLAAIEEVKRMAGLKGKTMITIYPHPSSIIDVILGEENIMEYPVLRLLEKPYLYLEPAVIKFN